jgi:hypothetical protein
MLVEVGANDVSAGASRPVAPAELQDLAESLGASRIQTLINILASAIVDTADRPRAIELVGAIARLFEAAGFATDNEANAKWKQPGLSTGLSLQFGTTDRA